MSLSGLGPRLRHSCLVLIGQLDCCTSDYWICLPITTYMLQPVKSSDHMLAARSFGRLKPTVCEVVKVLAEHVENEAD